MKFWITALCVLFVPALSEAGTYWVSPGGIAKWAICQGSTPPAIADNTAHCSLDTANLSVAAGDTVYLRTGTYDLAGGNNYDNGVAPYASGTRVGTACTAPITYRAYGTETPTITTDATNLSGIFLVGRECIKVFGLTFINFRHYYGYLSSSHYNEIAYNTFTATTTAGEIGSGLYLFSECAPNYNCWNTHNWIHHNTIEKRRNGAVCGEGTDLIRIGSDDSERTGADMTAANDYNTIEDNELRYASHTPLDTYGNYGVIARNFFHNEPWWTGDDATCSYPNDFYDDASFDGKYGHRGFQISDAYERESMYTLIEDNRVGVASTNAANNGANGMAIAGPRNIIRYNDLYGAMNSCVEFKYGWEYTTTGNGGTYNRFYNNTLYHCGYGNGSFYELTYAACVAAGGLNCSTQPQALLAVKWYVAETVGNILKNNLIYDTRRYTLSGFETGYGASTSSSPAGTVLTNNWLTSNGNPLFTSTTLDDPTSRTAPDFTLQATSGAINGGTHLTTTLAAGTSTTSLLVADARYFQDGTWGSNLARGVTFFPDWIAVGTVGNVAKIDSINYTTNTITLATPLTWSEGASVWLYKKSDGTVVLIGSAPDYGAHEYGSSTPAPSAPTNVRIR
jgi:hypothetical protein